MVGRIDRDGPHASAGEDKRRRRRAQPGPDSTDPADQRLDYAADDPDAEPDTGLHIDVTV